MRPPLALTRSTTSSASRHESAFNSFCNMAKETGSPVRSARSAIQSTSLRKTGRSNSRPCGATSKSPPPPATRPSAKPFNSSRAANVPGTGSPSRALWFKVREVEKPIAPACRASQMIFAICSMSSAVAGSLSAPRSPITYARTGAWGT